MHSDDDCEIWIETKTVVRKVRRPVPKITFTNEQGEVMASLQMDYWQQVTVFARVLDQNGKPAPVKNPTWIPTSSGVVTVEPAADGMSCNIKGRGPGFTNVTFSADASPDNSQVQMISEVLPCTINPGTATTIELTLGPITDQVLSR